MDALTFRLLSHLKSAFEDACGVVRYERESTGPEAGARQFYTKSSQTTSFAPWPSAIAGNMRADPEASSRTRCVRCTPHLP